MYLLLVHEKSPVIQNLYPKEASASRLWKDSQKQGGKKKQNLGKISKLDC